MTYSHENFLPRYVNFITKMSTFSNIRVIHQKSSGTLSYILFNFTFSISRVLYTNINPRQNIFFFFFLNIDGFSTSTQLSKYKLNIEKPIISINKYYLCVNVCKLCNVSYCRVSYKIWRRKVFRAVRQVNVLTYTAYWILKLQQRLSWQCLKI